MKQLVIIVVYIQMTISATSCGQENKHAPIDFVRSMWTVSANTKGMIQAETWYKDVGNEAGNARVYMIHKNGGDWWIDQARKKYPTKGYPRDWMLEDLKGNRVELNKYNKWAFFVDKKYLKGQPSYGDDFFQTDKNGNSYLPSEAEIKKIKERLVYYEKPNIVLEIILYEQKAGSKVWIEIDRHSFKTDQDGSLIHAIDPKTGKKERWKWDFLDRKLAESNAQHPHKN